MTSQYRAQYDAGYDPNLKFNPKALEHKAPLQAVIGTAVRGVATGIGLASEAVYSASDKFKGKNQAGTTASTSGTNQEEKFTIKAAPGWARDLSSTRFDEDDQEWELDEASQDLADKYEAPDGEQEGTVDIDTSIANVMSANRASQATESCGLLAPVVIPQRRPGTKSRGFVRAYAPMLNDAGIDQATFLHFLKELHRHSQASPIINAIMIGAGVAGLYPDIIISAVSLAVATTVGVAGEAQERWRTNKFLDRANNELFIPKGLYAIIISYTPTPDVEKRPVISSAPVDLAARAVAKYGQAESTDSEERTRKEEIKEKMKSFRLTSGNTFGEAQMPLACAPLIFPTLDAAAEGGEKTDNKMVEKTKSSSRFVQDYFDRRAQATYAHYQPDSTLAKQVSPNQRQFRSRYADPNHPAASGHLVSLLTGGHVNPEPIGARRRYEKAQKKALEQFEEDQKRMARGEKPKGKYNVALKRGLNESILYLMIVNMPTAKELEQAKQQMEEIKVKNGKAK